MLTIGWSQLMRTTIDLENTWTLAFAQMDLRRRFHCNVPHQTQYMSVGIERCKVRVRARELFTHLTPEVVVIIWRLPGSCRLGRLTEGNAETYTHKACCRAPPVDLLSR